MARRGGSSGRKGGAERRAPTQAIAVRQLGPGGMLAQVGTTQDPTPADLHAMENAIAVWNSRKADNTTQARLSDLAHLGSFAFYGSSPAETLARLVMHGPFGATAIVSAWDAAMINGDLADTTRARRIVTVRGAVAAAHRHDAGMSEDDMRGRSFRADFRLDEIEIPRYVKYGRTTGAAWQDVERKIAELERTAQWRYLALVLLLYDVGLRSAEASRLHVEHIDASAREIQVIRKGARSATLVAISTRCLHALQKAIAKRPAAWRGRGPVFTYGYREPRPLSHQGVHKIIGAMGLGRPHGLRHSGATRIAERTGDVRLAQAHLGHRSLQTTQIYLDTRMDALKRRAVDLLSGETDDGEENEGEETSAAASRESGRQANATRARDGRAQGHGQARARDRGSYRAAIENKGGGGTKKDVRTSEIGCRFRPGASAENPETENPETAECGGTRRGQARGRTRDKADARALGRKSTTAKPRAGARTSTHAPRSRRARG